MKRMIAALLALLMLTLCGCSGVVFGNGTLEWDANDVDHIRITNGLTGKTFSVADREIISTIVNHLNSFTLENGTNPESTEFSYNYCVTLVDKTNGSAESHYYLPDNETILIDGTAFIVNAKAFRQYLETLECDTMTDNELIDALLEGDTLERLNIMDEKGNISMDKIISLPQSCPALFELMTRPSAIQSIGSYGADKIGSFLNSTNPELVEKAQEWIEVLKQLIPEAKEKLENIIETYKNSENNP